MLGHSSEQNIGSQGSEPREGDIQAMSQFQYGVQELKKAPKAEKRQVWDWRSFLEEVTSEL